MLLPASRGGAKKSTSYSMPRRTPHLALEHPIDLLIVPATGRLHRAHNSWIARPRGSNKPLPQIDGQLVADCVISPGLHEWWPSVAYLILRTPNVGFCGANSGFSSQAQTNSALSAFNLVLAAPGRSERSSRSARTWRASISATGLSACFSHIESSARRRHDCVAGSRRLNVALA